MLVSVRRQPNCTTTSICVVAAVLAFTCVLATPATVLAQRRTEAASPTDTARARTLFRQGLSLADRGRWSEAARRFEEALALRPAAPIRYNLAAAFVELGRPVDAGTQLDLVLADTDTSQELRTQAIQLLGTVSAQTARLAVRLVGAPGSMTGVTVRVDDRDIAASDLGSAIRVQPGAFVAVALRDGREIGRAEGTVALGESAEVSIEVVPSPAQVAASSTSRERRDSAVAPTTSSSDDAGSSWPVMVGVGIGAAALVAGIVIVAVVAGRGVEEPVSGDLEPGVLRLGR